MFQKYFIILVMLLSLAGCTEGDTAKAENDNIFPYVKLFKSLISNQNTEKESLWIIVQFSETIDTNYGTHFILDNTLNKIDSSSSWSNENSQIWITSAHLDFQTPYVIVVSNYRNIPGETMNIFTTNFLFNKGETILSNHPANHIVISEICLGKFSTDNIDDEFIELYNPTAFDISLINNDIRIYQASSTGDPMLVCNFSSTNHFMNDTLPSALTIPAYGFYLIVNENASSPLVSIGDAVVKDSRMTLSKNKRIYICSSGTPSQHDNIIDFIGFGETENHEGTEPALNPEDGCSLQRKAYGSSTLSSMSEGEQDFHKGNSEDSDDNKADFILTSSPIPQNSLSTVEDWR